MDRRLRTTLMLLLLLGGVIAFARLYVKPKEDTQQRKAAEEWSRRFLFPDFIHRNAARFEILNDKGRVALDRRDGEWWIVHPIVEKGNHRDIQLASEAYFKIRWIRDDLTGPPDKPEFGLRPPQARLIGVAEDGREAPALLFGRQTSQDDQVYAMIEGDARLFTVDRQYLLAASRYLEEMRRREVIDPIVEDLAAIRSIELRFRDGAAWRMVHDGEEWRMIEPDVFRLDRMGMDNLITALAARAAVLNWPDDTGEGDSEFGLAEPEVVLTAVVEEPEGIETPRRIRLGVRDTRCYMKTDWTVPVYEVGMAACNHFSRPLDELRDRRMFPVTAQEVIGIEIEDRQEGVLHLKRTGDLWALDPGGPVAPSKVRLLLDDLLGVRAVSLEPRGSEKSAEAFLGGSPYAATVHTVDGMAYSARFGDDVGLGYRWTTLSRDPDRVYLFNHRSLIHWPKRPQDLAGTE